MHFAPLGPATALLLALAPSVLVAQTTWVVDLGGEGDFTSLQVAIDGAAPGDVLLIGPGTHGPGFAIDKSLTLQALVPEDPPVVGNLAVDGVPWVRLTWLEVGDVLLSDVPARSRLFGIDGARIVVRNCGELLLEDCNFSAGNPTALVAGESIVRIHRSTIRGGTQSYCFAAWDGHDALVCIDASRAYVYDSSVVGGGASEGECFTLGEVGGEPGSAVVARDAAQVVLAGNSESASRAGPLLSSGGHPVAAVVVEDDARVVVSGVDLSQPLDYSDFEYVPPFAATDHEYPQRPFARLVTAPPSLQPTALHAFGPAGSLGLLLVSVAPDAWVDGPLVEDPVWVDLSAVVLSAAVPLKGVHQPVVLSLGNPTSAGFGVDLYAQLFALSEAAAYDEDVVTGAGPTEWRDVLVEDLDKDGDLDVVAHRDSGVNALLNLDGSGSTWGDAPGPPLPGALISAIALADVDGDADPDLIVCDTASNRISWIENDQVAPFAAVNDIALELVGNQVRAGDLDGDGDFDLVVLRVFGFSEDELIRFVNTDGLGTFGAFRTVGSGEPSEAFELCDADADGDLDVLFGSGANGIRWHANAGDGTFGDSVPLPVSVPLDDFEVTAVAAGDVDGDGQLEACYAVWGELAGAPAGGVSWSEFAAGPGGPSGPHAISAGVFRADDLALLDVDLDGDLDVLATWRLTDRVSVFLNQDGVGTSWKERPYAVDSAGAIADGDFDLDGAADLVVAGVEVTRLSHGTAFLQPAAGNALDLLPLASTDCDADGVPDLDELAAGPGGDVDGNGLFDACQADCDGDGLPDSYAVAEGLAADCNGNDVPDECDVASGASADVDADGVPDECQPDCDGDGVPDDFEIASGASTDVNGNGVPDECEPDCDGDGVPDDHEIATGESTDVDADGVPDDCQPDCNGNGVPDDYEVATGLDPDCNANGLPDDCDVATGASADVDGDGVPDECETDCNGNGVPDEHDVATGASADLDGNGVPDECDPDCDGDGVPDAFEISSGASADLNGNGIPDECDPDCNGNGVPDDLDVASGTSADGNGNGVPDECEIPVLAWDFEAGAAGWVAESLWHLALPDECGSVTATMAFNRGPQFCDYHAGALPFGVLLSPPFAFGGLDPLAVELASRLSTLPTAPALTTLAVRDATTGAESLLASGASFPNTGVVESLRLPLPDLSALGPGPYRLVFRFGAPLGDASQHQGDGWQIDDVRVTGSN